MENKTLEKSFTISGFSDEIDESIKVQFQTLNELGIQYFEVRGVNGKNVADISAEELQALQNDMRAYGIQVSSIGSPIGKVLITEDFEPHFEKFKWVVHVAKTLGTKYLRMFSFYRPEGTAWEVFRGQILENLSRMIAYAEEQDVILLHENEKEIYGDTAVRCLDLMRELYGPHFKAVFDPANFVQCGVDVKEAYEMLAPYIVYMHIKDARADGSVTPAGMGIGQVPYVLRALKQKGYQGFLSLEPHLGSFAGLEHLETDDAMLKLEKSSKRTFMIAHNALKGILAEIEK